MRLLVLLLTTVAIEYALIYLALSRTHRTADRREYPRQRVSDLQKGSTYVHN